MNEIYKKAIENQGKGEPIFFGEIDIKATKKGNTIKTTKTYYKAVKIVFR
jgi:hypothetical protein